MKKVLGIPAYLFLMVVVVTATVSAAVMYTLTVPSNIEILPPAEGTYEVQVYEDEGCTTAVTSFDFGAVALGGESSVHFYIKNLSTVPVQVFVYARDHELGYHTFQVNGLATAELTGPGGPLELNEVREITLTLCTEVQVTPGSHAFNTVFEVTPTG